MKRLDEARHIAGVPFIVNSAYRTPEYELSKGRSSTSSHCKGCAVDLRCSNSSDRLRILTGLISAGFTRIGIAFNFIHVDYDKEKDSAIWVYRT